MKQIVAWYREDPNGLVVAPLPQVPEAEKLRDKIVLGAWHAEREDPDNPQSETVREEGVLATCSAFDEQELSDFRDDYRGKGPEAFPVEALAPGSQ